MCEQPTLFELEVLTKYTENGLECNHCGVVQPVENFERAIEAAIAEHSKK